MNTSNITTVKPVTSMTWLVDYSGELVNESRTESRSSDGKWLKRNVKLNAKRRSSDFNEMLAAESFENAA